MVSNGLYSKQACHNANTLLRKINSQTPDGSHCIVVIDEITADRNGSDLSEILNGIDKLIVLMAINPAAFEFTIDFTIIPPTRVDVVWLQLKTRHRNAFQIATLLCHYNFNINNDNSTYKSLSNAEDKPLDLEQMAFGSIPIWIKQNEGFNDLAVFEYILQNLVAAQLSVTVLHSLDLPKEIVKFCILNGWKTKTYWGMTGSEDDCIISIVEDNTAVLETFSRAKKQLIIVTRYKSYIEGSQISLKNLLNIFVSDPILTQQQRHSC